MAKASLVQPQGLGLGPSVPHIPAQGEYLAVKAPQHGMSLTLSMAHTPWDIPCQPRQP